MPNWGESMTQTFEYYVVDPLSWRDVRRITNVKASTINRDPEADTLGSASIEITDSIEECYVRIYLITIQNGIREKHPLGTFLVQTPSSSFDGRSRSASIDAYTPLMELKEKKPPIGYYIAKNENIMDYVVRLAGENMRAPVIGTRSEQTVFSNFVADPNDTWITFIKDLAANAKYEFGLDELSRLIFLPKQDVASLQPVWTYTDDNSSILYPSITLEHDLYNIPNVVEVIYSKGQETYYSRVVNDDPDSMTSIQSRGREIVHRIIDPDMIGDPTKHQIEEYAYQTLRDMSSLEFSISYTHGYCPVRIGDCVRLNYNSANLTNIKGKVVYQSIKCEPGCPVTEKAVFSLALWR